jgi:multicomponent Na+:H+ antiporter subunit G
MIIREVLAGLLFLTAMIFGTAGLVGLFRFPDPYSRLQAGSLCGTTAVFSIFIGALILSGSTAVTARVVIIMLFFLISAPTGSHIVARFIWQAGVMPWKPPRAQNELRKGGYR